MNTIKIYRLQITLQATEDISLPPHHGAVLYALLAAAYGLAADIEPVFPDGVMLDVPEQCRPSIRAHDEYNFGLTILSATEEDLKLRHRRIVNGLTAMGTQPKEPNVRFGGNYQVAAMIDLVAQRKLDFKTTPTSISCKTIVRDVEAVKQRAEITIRLTSPLRCQRSRKYRNDGHRYLDDSEFSVKVFLRRLIHRLSSLGVLQQSVDPTFMSCTLERHSLVWLDVAYGAKGKRKSLGGCLGELQLSGDFTELAEPLVLGQYVRVGESTRFGFGAYQIVELGEEKLACNRATSLAELAFEPARVDAYAAEHSLAPGVLTLAAANAKQGRHLPLAPIRFEIQEDDQRTRVLSLPHPIDRALQRLVAEHLAPSLDGFFEASSLAYRRGFGRHRAAKRVQTAFREGFHWAVRADIHRFFDSVDHELLRRRLDAYVQDNIIVSLIMSWIEVGAPYPGQGLPTGAPISPLLANLFLDRFDEAVEAEDARLVRYSDDMLILCRTQEDATKLLRQAKSTAEKLQLSLNAEGVSKLTQPFSFLGFDFFYEDSWSKTEPGNPKQIEDLGWFDASAVTNPARSANLISLPGENVNAPTDQGTTVVIGPGAVRLEANAATLCCEYVAPRKLLRIDAYDAQSIVILGAVSIDASFWHAQAKYQWDCYLSDRSGNLTAVIEWPSPHATVALVEHQLRATRDGSQRLHFARAIVSAKLNNYAELAKVVAVARTRQLADKLRSLSQQVENAQDIDQILGLEGAGAAAWYGAFSAHLGGRFPFERRAKPRASDPVNVMLNIAHTTLYRLSVLAVKRAGLLPLAGIYHAQRAGHFSLASDLQEPFRFLMDRAVLEASRTIRPGDFRTAKSHARFPLVILPGAARRLAETIHRVLHIPYRDQSGELMSYRQHIFRQARRLAASLPKETERFAPFRCAHRSP
ncbi:MAG: CRISPR-associated endonuclease Cas1 [Pirellulales bacterium]|nr:CRISPR-associated endonuclease Cas1 [Pirellulales bacterium]